MRQTVTPKYLPRPDGYIFNYSVVSPGNTPEEAWENFVLNPKPLLPKNVGQAIAVTGANAQQRSVTCFVEAREPTVKEMAFANHHGWSLEESMRFQSKTYSFYKEHSSGLIKVIPWNLGWAPSHPATGVFDNAAWGSAIHALNVADTMFFDGNRDDILGWFGTSEQCPPHPARPKSTYQDDE